MTSDDPFSISQLRRRLFDILETAPDSAEPEPQLTQPASTAGPSLESQTGSSDGNWQRRPLSPVFKAIPLAFPIVEPSYSIHERIPEPLGMIRRGILRAVCEFGPCNSQRLDELLGLGADIIERTLTDMCRSVPELKRAGDHYSAGPECTELLKSDRFNRYFIQDRKFLVNGLTDRLLPINFWKRHSGLRLFPDATEPSGPMCTESGIPTEIETKLADRGVTGRANLEELIAVGDRDSLEQFGLPPGACATLDPPVSLQINWVLSFLLLRFDSSVEILTARRNPSVLLARKQVTRDYLRRISQGPAKGLLSDRAPRQPTDRWRQRWPAGTEFGAGKTLGEICVSIPEPEILLKTESSLEKETKVAKQLLESGHDWVPPAYSLHRIVPGDLRTARTAALLQGIRELRRILRPIETVPGKQPSFQLNVWWQDWLTAFSATVGMNCTESSIPVQEFLKACDDINDTDFQEKLEWIQG